MPTKETPHHRRDCVRIVPLATPEVVQRAAAPAPAAKLVYNDGPLITEAQVFTIFWGSAWQESAQADSISELNGFFDYILKSPLMDQLAEYNVANYRIGHGARIGATTITTPAVSSTVDDAAIQRMIQQQISAGVLPKSSANTIYFVFLPSGVTVTQGGSASCQVFCGYHDAISNDIFYAVMPYPDCSGCSNGMATLDALTVTASHELCEAITDPIPGAGWYDQQNGEIGDICAWQIKKIGKYTVQKEWSNQAGSCV